MITGGGFDHPGVAFETLRSRLHRPGRGSGVRQNARERERGDGFQKFTIECANVSGRQRTAEPEIRIAVCGSSCREGTLYSNKEANEGDEILRGCSERELPIRGESTDPRR